MSRIDSILNMLEAPSAAPVTTKTASASGSPVDAAVDAVIAKLEGTTKTASAGGASPVSDLMKLAAEVREADVEGEIKLARRMGAAFTDGMVERAELYRGQSDEMNKTAAAQEHDALEKFAAENPAQYAALVSEGFFEAAGSTKQAAAEYDEGFIEKAAEIHDIASAHFIEGYNRLGEALQG